MSHYQTVFVLSAITLLVQLFFIECKPFFKSSRSSKFSYPMNTNKYFYPKATNQRRITTGISSNSPLWTNSNGRNVQKTNYQNNPNLVSTRTQPLNSGVFVPRLPNHYLNINHDYKYSDSNRNYMHSNPYYPQIRKQTYKSAVIPVFQNFQENLSDVIIYTGKKAEMIFNTLMNQANNNYEMKEPIPGQIMQPPVTPIYRPNSWKQTKYLSGFRKSATSFNTPHSSIIPFYPHEAIINPRNYRIIPTQQPIMTTTTTTRPYYVHIPYEQNNFLMNYEATTKSPNVIYGFSYPTLRRYPEITTEVFNDDQEVANNQQFYNYQNHLYDNKDETSKPEILNEITESPLIVKETTGYNLSDHVAQPYYKNHRMEDETTPIISRASLTYNQNAVQNVDKDFRLNTYNKPNPVVDNEMPKKPKSIYSAKFAGFQSNFELPIYKLNQFYKNKNQITRPRKFQTETVLPSPDVDDDDMEMAESQNSLNILKEFSNSDKNIVHEEEEPAKRSIEIRQKFSTVQVHPNMSWIIFGPKKSNENSSIPVDNDEKLSSKYEEEFSSYRNHLSPRSQRIIPKVENSASTVLGAKMLVES